MTATLTQGAFSEKFRAMHPFAQTGEIAAPHKKWGSKQESIAYLVPEEGIRAPFENKAVLLIFRKLNRRGRTRKVI